MVPISRKRSVTAMSWALTIPATQTRSESVTIHRCLGFPRVRSGSGSYPARSRTENRAGSPEAAMPSTRSLPTRT
jgi:hypothetical protein